MFMVEVYVRQIGIQKTTHAKPSTVEQGWWVVDASEHRLGRLATKLAMVLQGKHKPSYSPHIDCGDFVIVKNASKVQLTGNKAETREYTYWTGYMGGLRSSSLGALLARKPEKVLELAVRRMLPKGILGKKMLKKMKVYPGEEHPHAAQNAAQLVVK